MKSVFKSWNEAEAHLFKNLLTAEGIHPHVVPMDNYAYGGPPKPAEVYVPENDYDRAVALASDFKAPAPVNLWKWSCECGEHVEEQFTTCWNCGRARPSK